VIFVAKTSIKKGNMYLKINFVGSKNFEVKHHRIIKYLIIHYTGMRNQALAIARLQSRVAKVSSHYLISKRGKIYQLVKDENIAWHAGKSRWEKDVNLNSKSIGIELVNNGKEIFPKNQIRSLLKLLLNLKKKYKIKTKYILGHEDIAPRRKKDPGPKFPWSKLTDLKLSKKR
tara:strand:- start:177 stop:695 length:519 start_codon:yes stop_codon:yes gene_type:complete